jgi:hypothetical protein
MKPVLLRIAREKLFLLTIYGAVVFMGIVVTIFYIQTKTNMVIRVQHFSVVINLIFICDGYSNIKHPSLE